MANFFMAKKMRRIIVGRHVKIQISTVYPSAIFLNLPVTLAIYADLASECDKPLGPKYQIIRKETFSTDSFENTSQIKLK